MPQLYDELKQLAARRMSRENPGQSISGTVLLHEAYLRLSKESDGPKWANRKQFFSAAAEAMRRILLDRVRAKSKQKRGAAYKHISLNESDIAQPAEEDQLLAVNAALDELAKSYPDTAEIVKLRFFVGFSSEEIAEHLGMSVSTVTRQWAYARIWLSKHISSGS